MTKPHCVTASFYAAKAVERSERQCEKMYQPLLLILNV